MIRAQRAVFALVPALSFIAARAPAQTRWYASVVRGDTTSIERFERRGSTITGVWVTYHRGGVREILRHEYTVNLTSDGRPISVHLVLRHPGGPVVGTYESRFTDDSVVITDSDDTVPHRIAARRPYPILGRSMAMMEVLIGSVSRRKQAPDSATVVVAPITGPYIAQAIPIVRPDARTVVLGGAGAQPFLIGPGGAIDSVLTPDGRAALRQVAAFDIDAIALAAAKTTLSSPGT